MIENCIQEQEIILSYWDLFNLEIAFEEVLPRYDLHLQGEKGLVRHCLKAKGVNIPVKMAGPSLKPVDNNSTWAIRLILEDIDCRFSLLMIMQANDNEHPPTDMLFRLVGDLSAVIRGTVPSHFESVEHLKYYLGSESEIRLMKLTESLLWPALNAAEQLFADYEFQEEVTYFHQPDIKAEKIRVESRDGKGLFVTLNSFKIFQQGNIIAAIGLSTLQEIEKASQQVVGFTA